MKDTRYTPPTLFLRFFRWFCDPALRVFIEGDLIELYQRRCRTFRKTKADIYFAIDVLLLFRPGIIRSADRFDTINHYTMYRNYLKIAWRSMTRQKMYALIKVGGFALGLATCIIIFLFIRHELSYDKQYKDSAQIYRLYNEYKESSDEKWTAFPPSITHILKTEYPEVEQAGRLIPYKWFNAGSNLFRRDDQKENTYEEGFAYADQELLEILEIPLVYGNPLHALDKPNTIVLSKSKADKYFPNENPVGRNIVLNDDPAKTFMVGGVMKDFAVTSHLQYDFFITLTGVEFWPGEQTSWCCWNYNPYVKLRPGTDPAQLEKKMLAIKDKYYVGYLNETKSQSAEDVKKYHSFHLQPVSDIYLHSSDIMDEIKHGDIRYVWLFGGIAIFILLLACINFINLSTAKSANRAKEVGLRKVVGSVRGHLIRQFLTESMVYSFVSFALGIVIVWVSLPYFNVIAGRSLSIPWLSWWFYPVLLGSAFMIGLLAGAYPSFYLSAFKPIQVLKGNISRGSKNATLRNVMVVFQFTTSIILIIGTFVIYRQMNYILNTKIGFDKEQVIEIQGANTLNKKQATFKNELLKLRDVEHVTISNYLPVTGTNRDQNGFWREGKSTEEKSVGAQKWYVDEDYISTLGMKLAEGRNFLPNVASDSQAIIINQAMAKAIGLKNPVGERIMTWETFTVVGVVEDFHFESMKGKIGPLAMVLGDGGDVISIKVKTEDMQRVLQSITGLWNTFMPFQPIRYTFLDESYARMYDDVQRMGQLFASFAVLAIIVACLGLFALSAFMVEQRNKEISIRLVLGASVNNIVRLLTQNFVLLVVLSFVIATPVAWYLMQTWLEDYAYKTSITWDIFILSGVAAIAIALLTISYQSIRAALANPATRLRSE
ncbi:MAG TPA: ABC transporter permease [Ohtaekwangia sp.]|uniref:ABC transporter permease n=1 Tax=Ohtaekwangia sp. TaxID=2066019 RepID=UPI002F95C208